MMRLIFNIVRRPHDISNVSYMWGATCILSFLAHYNECVLGREGGGGVRGKGRGSTVLEEP